MGKIAGIIGVLVMLLVVWQSYLFFSGIKEPIRSATTDATAYVKEHVTVEEITNVNFYHGTDSYQVFASVDEDGEEVYIWVPETLDTHLLKRKVEGISFEDVATFAKQELEPKKLISIKLGVEQTIPLYEITYLDNQDRLSYYYMTFKDGTYLKHYHLGK